MSAESPFWVSGALAQATSDFVPYALLAGIMLATLIVIQRWAPRAWLTAARHHSVM
jgi:hypothetical protein